MKFVWNGENDKELREFVNDDVLIHRDNNCHFCKSAKALIKIGEEYILLKVGSIIYKDQKGKIFTKKPNLTFLQ